MKVKKLEAVRVDANSVKDYIAAVKSGWSVKPSDDVKKIKKPNLEKSSKVFESQKQAAAYAREIALKYQNELSIHGSNGKIKEKFMSGDYSFPPRG
jgi:hypothetical protein